MHRCGYLQRQRPTPQVERDHHWVHRKCLGFNSWKYISPCVGMFVVISVTVEFRCQTVPLSPGRSTTTQQVPFCSFYLFQLLCCFIHPFLKKNVKKGAHKPGMWACSGEIHATSHLLQCRIACFGFSASSGKHEWSWYPSSKHYTDAPIILLYNINADHFLLVQRIKTNILIS